MPIASVLKNRGVTPSIPKQIEKDSLSFEELKKTIQLHFLNTGVMKVSNLYEKGGTIRARVNWYAEDENGQYIYDSRFVFAKKVDGKFVIEDHTV